MGVFLKEIEKSLGSKLKIPLCSFFLSRSLSNSDFSFPVLLNSDLNVNGFLTRTLESFIMSLISA